METSSGIQASLGGRYALALFELARDDRALEAVEESLATVREAIGESDALRALIESPLVARPAAKRAILAVANELGLDPTTTNFLGVLAENRRLDKLVQIIKAFNALAARHRGETVAEVTSAHPLDPPQVDELRHQLRLRVGRDVSLDLSVDSSLLGGLVVRIGSKMIDSSIRTRLNSLAHAMKG